MTTVVEFTHWLEACLRSADVPASAVGWRVCSVLVTFEASRAFGLEVPAGGCPLNLAGGRIPLRVLDAQARDVWVELGPVDAHDRRRELVMVELTVGLEPDAAIAYRALREIGCSPAEAAMVARVTAIPPAAA